MGNVDTPQSFNKRFKEAILEIAVDALTRPGHDPGNEFDKDLIDLAVLAGNSKEEIRKAATTPL